VGGDAAHVRSLRSRRGVILACSAAATRSSAAGSFAIRTRSAASISSALFPVAQIRKDVTEAGLVGAIGGGELGEERSGPPRVRPPARRRTTRQTSRRSRGWAANALVPIVRIQRPPDPLRGGGGDPPVPAKGREAASARAQAVEPQQAASSAARRFRGKAVQPVEPGRRHAHARVPRRRRRRRPAPSGKMRKRAWVAGPEGSSSASKRCAGVRQERGSRQQLAPRSGCLRKLGDRHPGDPRGVRNFQRAALRSVALEVAVVDLHSVHGAAGAEL